MPFEDSYLDASYEEWTELPDPPADFECIPDADDAEEQPFDGAGVPGCGDGSDDLADYNSAEANDYINE